MIFFKLHLKANHNFCKPLNFAFGWLGLSLRNRCVQHNRYSYILCGRLRKQFSSVLFKSTSMFSFYKLPRICYISVYESSSPSGVCAVKRIVWYRLTLIRHAHWSFQSHRLVTFIMGVICKRKNEKLLSYKLSLEKTEILFFVVLFF